MNFKDDDIDIERYGLKDIPDPFERLFDDLKETLNELSAPVGRDYKPVEELTNREQIAICWAAGVDMEFISDQDTGMVSYKTMEPCAIVLDGRAYRVISKSVLDEWEFRDEQY